MIACCGLDCTKCEAFIATAQNDNAKRAAVAEKWSQMFNASLKAEQINCTGCQSSGIKFVHCEHMCEIRKCTKGKALTTCAECAEFACDRLEPIFQMAPQAKQTLLAMRKP